MVLLKLPNWICNSSQFLGSVKLNLYSISKLARASKRLRALQRFLKPGAQHNLIIQSPLDLFARSALDTLKVHLKHNNTVMHASIKCISSLSRVSAIVTDKYNYFDVIWYKSIYEVGWQRLFCKLAWFCLKEIICLVLWYI